MERVAFYHAQCASGIMKEFFCDVGHTRGYFAEVHLEELVDFLFAS